VGSCFGPGTQLGVTPTSGVSEESNVRDYASSGIDARFG